MSTNEEKTVNANESMDPAVLLYDRDILTDPADIYADSVRKFQGIPCIERTRAGRVFFAFYTGMQGEEAGNYVLLFYADHDANKKATVLLAVTPPTKNVRCFDPCLWIAPDGRLWLFWAQSYGFYDGRQGVWCSVCDEPDTDALVFSVPRRIANGIMMNKPIVTSDHRWLLPCAIWEGFRSELNDLSEERFSNVYCSEDNGVTFSLLSHTAYSERFIDEHMLVEKQNGDIWMLIRARNGIGQALSQDGGRSWGEESDTGWGGPCSRFCIRRLASGRLLLVNHVLFHSRNNLTALLSEDDGATWQGGLLLDGRNDVSYPDMTESADGRLFIIHDYNRYSDKEILLDVITEADILTGKIVDERSRLGVALNKATGTIE